eukprot:2461284-Alexandrium_andersonii.AAC.1
MGDFTVVEVGQAHGRLAQEAQGLFGAHEPELDAGSLDQVPQRGVTQLEGHVQILMAATALHEGLLHGQHMGMRMLVQGR